MHPRPLTMAVVSVVAAAGCGLAARGTARDDDRTIVGPASDPEDATTHAANGASTGGDADALDAATGDASAGDAAADANRDAQSDGGDANGADANTSCKPAGATCGSSGECCGGACDDQDGVLTCQ